MHAPTPLAPAAAAEAKPAKAGRDPAAEEERLAKVRSRVTPKLQRKPTYSARRVTAQANLQRMAMSCRTIRPAKPRPYAMCCNWVVALATQTRVKINAR